MRHLIEVQERIAYYDNCIDHSDYIEHYTDAYNNSMYYRRIEALKHFLYLVSKHNKESLKKEILKEIKNWKNNLLNNKELNEEDTDILKRYISEGEWYLEDTELPNRYTKEIKNIKKKIKELNKQIKEKEKVIWEIYNDNVQ